MYDYIKGIFTYKTEVKGSYITVEAGGIGYKFEIMERDFALLPEVDTEIKIYNFHPEQNRLNHLHQMNLKGSKPFSHQLLKLMLKY